MTIAQCLGLIALTVVGARQPTEVPLEDIVRRVQARFDLRRIQRGREQAAPQQASAHTSAGAVQHR